MDFPKYRPRRLRRNERLRALVRETSLSADHLIYPLFVGPGKDSAQPVASMPGVAQLSLDRAVKECEEASALGIPAVILFGIPERKDGVGSEAYTDDGVVQQAVRAIKDRTPELLVITDVCLCEYTDHGHCGVIRRETGDVDNDGTLELLALAPHPLSMLVIAKVISHWLLTGLPLALMAPLIGLQYQLGADALGTLLASLFIGTPVLSVLGAACAALTLGARGAGVLLGLLLLPLYVPVLVFAAGAVLAVQNGLPAGAHLSLLGAFLAVSSLVGPLAACAALRIALD